MVWNLLPERSLKMFCCSYKIPLVYFPLTCLFLTASVFLVKNHDPSGPTLCQLWFNCFLLLEQDTG